MQWNIFRKIFDLKIIIFWKHVQRSNSKKTCNFPMQTKTAGQISRSTKSSMTKTSNDPRTYLTKCSLHNLPEGVCVCVQLKLVFRLEPYQLMTPTRMCSGLFEFWTSVWVFQWFWWLVVFFEWFDWKLEKSSDFLDEIRRPKFVCANIDDCFVYLDFLSMCVFFWFEAKMNNILFHFSNWKCNYIVKILIVFNRSRQW